MVRRSKLVSMGRALVAVFVFSTISVLVLLHARALHADVTQPSAATQDALSGTPLGADHLLGDAIALGNLSVFPVYAKSPVDLGEFTTLERAISANEAEVRELGSDGAQAHAGDPLGAAQVNTLVVQNKGKRSILVLAGTVVKGGKQDRQIAEDFVVEAGKTVDVAAFCVEQGRWNGTRDGKSTGGRFVAHKTLALSKLREAGAYEGNQSQVWAEVGKVNAAHAKDAPSSTLMASADDPALAQKRAQLAGSAARALGSVKHASHVVGVAYAVEGEVLGVRWFAGPKLFELYRDTLLESAAFEAITAEAEAKASGKASKTTPAKAADVSGFVARMESETVSEQKARHGQVGAKKKADAGYASELSVELPAASPGAKPKAAPVTKDYLRRSAPKPQPRGSMHEEVQVQKRMPQAPIRK